MEILNSFENLVGGTENLSTSFSLRQFATPRIEEILMLTEALNDEPSKGLVFQRLPKHMRRRQMSHHQSRLPRRLRSEFAAQKKVTPSKRPSRKFRRKPSNLLADYDRRKKSKIWLETHIWHAKRFHMTEKWGYRLAQRPTNKGFRANYRAIKSHCLLIDTSYLSVIELEGSEDKLANGLMKCTSRDCGLTFMARAYTTDSKEGSVTIFHPDSYPQHVIGNVSFLWQPKTNKCRKLWIWVHPALYDEIVECFTNAFYLKDCSAENGLPTYNSDDVTMKSLKDTLNRFKLIGPLSSCILADALQADNVINEETVPSKTCENNKENNDCSPCKKMKLCDSIINNENGEIKNYKESLVDQIEAFAGLSTRPPSLYPSGATFGLSVIDPRMTQPPLRKKSVFTSQDLGIANWKWSLAMSPLWEESIRNDVSKNRLSDFQVNQIRSKCLVPNMQIQQKKVAVPILLIQQPGNAGFGAGWDVIIPSKWAMTFWRAFVLRGARTGGLRETNLLKIETASLKTSFQPDSAAGMKDEEQRRETLEERFFKLPPSKRPNFIKLGILNPFSTPWNTALNVNIVIRDLKFLLKLSDCLKFKREMCLTNYNQNGLVAISLKCPKGKPESLARICLPNGEDFKSKDNVEEPIHVDFKKSIRIEIRNKNKEFLKKWKRDRLKQKSGGDAKWKDSDIELLKKSNKELMRKNWLLDEDVPNQRSIIGFVTDGDFKFSSGNGLALGYVTLSSILKILNHSISLKKAPVVLLRNTNHRLYRKASFQILLN